MRVNRNSQMESLRSESKSFFFFNIRVICFIGGNELTCRVTDHTVEEKSRAKRCPYKRENSIFSKITTIWIIRVAGDVSTNLNRRVARKRECEWIETHKWNLRNEPKRLLLIFNFCLMKENDWPEAWVSECLCSRTTEAKGRRRGSRVLIRLASFASSEIPKFI